MTRIIRILLLTLLFGLPFSGVFADPLGEAEQALNSGEYQQALSLFQPLAEQGEPGAMIGLGRMYQGGLGVTASHDTAISWYSKGVMIWNERAKNGDPRAYASLGVLFNKGIGFEKDTARARQYFRTAFDMAQPKALEGDNDAQHLIGMLYSSGKGVDKDIFAGADWLTKAGEGGNETAMKMLLHIFECGCRGLPKDDAKAEYWRAKLTALR
ncbi:MAG: sel1 repeat family protein [Gammaproteobacteria bacterium]|nr:sel1 repeat family protein [Gammaproteobacteria bacterium]